MFESLVLFDVEYYKQIDGVAIASHLDQLLLIFFSVILNKRNSKTSLANLYPSFIKDMFMTTSYYFDQNIILKNLDVILILLWHPNFKFASEIEEENAISFLDIKIRTANNSFSVSIYRNVPLSGVFTNFECFITVSLL